MKIFSLYFLVLFFLADQKRRNAKVRGNQAGTWRLLQDGSVLSDPRM
jgi:hypothetical protein